MAGWLACWGENNRLTAACGCSPVWLAGSQPQEGERAAWTNITLYGQGHEFDWASPTYLNQYVLVFPHSKFDPKQWLSTRAHKRAPSALLHGLSDNHSESFRRRKTAGQQPACLVKWTKRLTEKKKYFEGTLFAFTLRRTLTQSGCFNPRLDIYTVQNRVYHMSAYTFGNACISVICRLILLSLVSF
jgi:hypothetical protein